MATKKYLDDTGLATLVNKIKALIPTKLSDLTDDLGSSPTHTHSQYLTSHQDISGKADLSYVNNLIVALGLDTDTYYSTSTYNSGDLVVKNNTVYECNTNNTTGTWDSSKWDLVPIIINE